MDSVYIMRCKAISFVFSLMEWNKCQVYFVDLNLIIYLVSNVIVAFNLYLV